METKEQLEIQKLEEEIKTIRFNRQIEVIKTIVLIISAMVAIVKIIYF